MSSGSLPEEVSRHKCLIYEGDPGEHLSIIVPFLVEGLREKRQCLCLGSPEMVSAVRSALRHEGLDVGREEGRRSLILSSSRGHLEGDAFDPRSLVEMLSRMTDDAVGDGFAGLCATGDMAWEFGPEKNFDRLLEYEALLEKLFRQKPLTGICQYRRDAVPPAALRDALLTHRSIYVGEDLRRDNFFYVPPEILLGGAGTVPGDTGRWMCDQIRRVIRAERDRDQALALLRRSEDEQRTLAEQLAEMNQDLERRVRERTEDMEGFVSSVSHDLRAPLRAMDGYAQLLLEGGQGRFLAEDRQRIDQIQRAAGRMRQLVDALLELARTGRARIHPEPVDMAALAREAAQELGAGREGRALVTVGALPSVRGDRALLRQVWVNLIGNALKFSSGSNGARVDVGASRGPEGVTYFVRDNGVGFDMKDAGKLFEVFNRLHSRERFEGTGIGLALVKRIVTRHGGAVRAEGAPGGGATFSFTLPAAES